MIKKIKSIKGMAVYKNFEWDNCVKEKGGRAAEFQKINIIYGRNYSGKTTVSRIIRALETGFISDKYINPEFDVEIQGGGNVKQNTLKNHNQIIRVFNDDFIRDNLQFIINSNENIKPFAILGDNNNRLEQEIKHKELELGNEEDGTGHLGEMKLRRSEYNIAKLVTSDYQKKIDDKLYEKANKAGTGIKHNKLYGDATYNITKLKADINIVTDDKYHPLAEEEVDILKQLLKEEPKQIIEEPSTFVLKYAELARKTKELVEKKITISEPIQELLDDAVLQEWVRNGKAYHEGKRESCIFCGSPIGPELWVKLNKHFNQESESLRLEIGSLIKQIEEEARQIDKLIILNINDFYSTFKKDIEILLDQFNISSKKYSSSLKSLIDILNMRLSNIFAALIFNSNEDVTEQLREVCTRYESIRVLSNSFTQSLTAKQKEAIRTLLHNEIYIFITDIKYIDEQKEIKKLKEIESSAYDKYTKALLKVSQTKEKIQELKTQLKDETKGAECVNQYLTNYFGHDSLTLVAKEEDAGYQFEITRNGQKAYHLSEGEQSLIAFCYFMAKLGDVETKDNNPIIWIDDPISSLDANHIFFVFSLINSEIVKPGKFTQLFISTHNLDFLKYLKRLIPKDIHGNNLERRYFMIERINSESQINIMPSYLKSYVTEFNYLFHQIYKCANADIETAQSDYDCFYNYANNARKFLEAYLYYKYPNANEKDESKLLRFFGDDTLSTVLTERINNEYSHLAGVFERSLSPIDIPEMKKTAQFILYKIKAKDLDQYKALLESIGATENF